VAATALLDALLGGPTWVVARAEPGLGRLTEAVSLSTILARSDARPPTRFYTTPAVVPLAQRLLRRPVRPFELGRGDDPQQTLIDSPGVQQLLLALRRQRPAAVVVDGSPLLLPLLRAVSPTRLVAMANLHDLRNPAHSPGARLLQEALHLSSDLILVSELRRGWVGSVIGPVPVLRIPSLIRAPDPTGWLWHDRRPAAPVVAVLGGGSRGDSRLQASDRALLAALEEAVARGDLPACLVFAGGGQAAEFPHLEFGADPTACLPTLAQAELVITRAGRSTLAEVLAHGRRAVAVIPQSDTLRGAEQAANASAAARLSPAVIPLPVTRLDRLGEACRRAAAAVPRSWQPGNAVVLEALASI
jgi:hypothetical protein